MMSAYVFVQVAVSGGWKSMDELHHALHAVAGVKTVHFLAGPTDIVLYMEAMDPKGMMDILGNVRALKGVTSTDTRVVWPV